MAQDVLNKFNALHNQPANASGTLIAPMVLLSGHRVIKFPAGVARAAYFIDILTKLYNGLGITVNILHITPTVVAPKLAIAFERHNAGQAISPANFANAKTVTLTAPSAGNTWTYSTLDFSDGAEIGSLVALEGFRLRIERVAADGVAQAVYVSRVFLTNTG